jgi:2-polyprenyl-3-methyl-5-hydroxy-6-metoxy-1,4-benzoquinol methylase
LATLAERAGLPWLLLRKFGRHTAMRWRRVRERLAILRYHVPGERTRCPACESRRIRLLEPLPVRGHILGRQVAFISGCAACGLVFVNPTPTASDLEHFYSPDGAWGAPRQDDPDTHDRKPSPRYLQVVFDPIRPQLDVDSPPPGARVLDFGCGAGGFLDALRERGWETFGVEPAIKTAFTRHTELADPPGTPTFDLVILNHVLEHVDNPLRVLESLARSMHPRGFVYISVPRLDALGEHGDLEYCISGRAHVMAFSRDCLAVLLAKAGLDLVAVVDPDSSLTSGRPVRLRVLAQKTDRPAVAPRHPLEAAVRALSAYERRHDGAKGRAGRWLPARIRAGLLDYSRKMERRQEKAALNRSDAR